ncbi:MAG TPA: tetratricopeptide repeat protein [Vicinamibacterales bacterium]
MRRHRFLVFLAAVFAAKLIVVLQLRDHPLLQPGTGLDTTVYTQLASRVAAGDVWLGPGLYFISPLYVYFLAAVLAATRSFTAARVLQILLGTGAVAFVYVAAREWFGTRAAWLAAILAALTGLFTFHEVLLLQAALDPFLTAAALAALAVALNLREPTIEDRGSTFDSRARWFMASGLAFGIQTLNRPNVLIPAAVVILLLVVTRRFRPALFMAAGLALALAPVTIRNAEVAGDWSPASSHGGLNFYIGNNAEADGTYRLVPGITPNLLGQQEDARRVAEASAGRKLDDGDVSGYFYGLGLSWIQLHPADAARLFVRKLRFVFNARYISVNYSYPFYAYDEGTLLALFFVGPWLLLPLGLVGLAIGILRGSRPGGPGPPEPREGGRTQYLIWLSFVPVYAVAVAIFFVAERYRLPLLVAMCVGGGSALDYVFRLKAEATGFSKKPRGFRTYAEGSAALAAVIALAALTNLPMRADDGRAEERARMAEAMVTLGRYDEAEAWLKKAEEGTPKPGAVHFRIGRLLLVHGKPEAALVHFERALHLNPGDAEVEYAVGQALVDAKRFKAAIPHLEAALRAGVRVNLAGYDLARARAGAGDRAGALQTLQGIRSDNPADPQAWDVLGQLALQLQSPSLAASFFNEAIRAAPRASKPRQDLGLALAMMGRHAEAIAQFREGVMLDPADAAARLNFAVALAEAGRKAEARGQAQEALRLKPDYARARQFLRVLK